MKIAFLGLGVMGYPMAGHLSRYVQNGDGEVCVYNRTQSKATAWCADFTGRAEETPRAAVSDADLIMCCVGNDDDVRAVCLGENGAFAGMKPGAIFIDHTTASANLARELDAEAQRIGCHFMDAPVSGGQAGAESGQLTIMVGGDSVTFESAQPVLACYAKAVKLMGGVGSGQLTKMVNQICITGLLQSLSEALFFAERVGLDGRDVIDAISKGAAQSWQMENRYMTMLEREFDFGFAVDWMRKDLAIAMEEAKQHDIQLPLVELIDGYYADVQALGGSRWDTSSLIRRLDAISNND